MSCPAQEVVHSDRIERHERRGRGNDGQMKDDAIVERPDNLVFLRGRLAETPVERELPSGDVLLSFRLTVPRPPGERVRVDSLECVAVKASLRRTVGRSAPGDELEVEGSLQRRFWRSPTGPASRYAVAATSVRRTKSVRAAVKPRRRADA